MDINRDENTIELLYLLSVSKGFLVNNIIGQKYNLF